MQHGNARPLAVKYMTVHGRRHSDQGFVSFLRARLSPGSATPEALKLMPSVAACSCAAARWRDSSRVRRSNSAWSGLAMPIGAILESRQPERGTHLPIDDVSESLADDQESSQMNSVDAKIVFAKLKGREREIVLAISVEGASARQVAQRLGMTEGAVRVALHRAL